MLSTHDEALATMVAGLSNVVSTPAAGYAGTEFGTQTNGFFAGSGMTTAEQAQTVNLMKDYQRATGNENSAGGWAKLVAASTYNRALDQELASQKETACIRFATLRTIAKTQLTDGFHYNLICRPTANCGTDNEHYKNYYRNKCGYIDLDGYQTNYSKFTSCDCLDPKINRYVYPIDPLTILPNSNNTNSSTETTETQLLQQELAAARDALKETTAALQEARTAATTAAPITATAAPATTATAEAAATNAAGRLQVGSPIDVITDKRPQLQADSQIVEAKPKLAAVNPVKTKSAVSNTNTALRNHYADVVMDDYDFDEDLPFRIVKKRMLASEFAGGSRSDQTTDQKPFRTFETSTSIAPAGAAASSFIQAAKSGYDANGEASEGYTNAVCYTESVNVVSRQTYARIIAAYGRRKIP